MKTIDASHALKKLQVKPGFTNHQRQPSSLGPEVKQKEEEQKNK